MLLVQAAFWAVVFCTCNGYERQEYNILLIISDDLRADIGGWYKNDDESNGRYGSLTPNLDSFQKDSVTFLRAYTQYAFCNPSRTSFLTGLRPDITRVFDGSSYFRDPKVNINGSLIITMPQYFKQFGNYYTVGSGKIYHPFRKGRIIGPGSCSCFMGNDEPYSWNHFTTCQDSTYNGQLCSELNLAKTRIDKCIEQRSNKNNIEKFKFKKNVNWAKTRDLINQLNNELKKTKDKTSFNNKIGTIVDQINDESGINGCLQNDKCLECLHKWNCYTKGKSRSQIICPADCDDDCFFENQVADITLRYIKRFKDKYDNGSFNNSNNISFKSFFIAAGFHRPHMGYYAPLRFYEKYGYMVNETNGLDQHKFDFVDKYLNKIDEMQSFKNVPVAKNNFIVPRAPQCAYKSGDDLLYYQWRDVKPHVKRYNGFYQTLRDGSGNWSLLTVNKNYQRFSRGAYYSSVSYMDEQFGKIINGLKKYGYYNNTIIVFMSDHGYQLGEQSTFSKHTHFEASTRIPLIIRVPGMNKDTYGKKTDIIVECVDIMPTLIDATFGLNNFNNYNKYDYPLSGKSLLDIISNVHLNSNSNSNSNYFAYSQYHRDKITGISVRTNDWRYVEWINYNNGNSKHIAFPKWDINNINNINNRHGIDLIRNDENIYAIELYDHSNKLLINDYNRYDTFNLAYNKSVEHIVNQLHEVLVQTWNSHSYKQNMTNITNIMNIANINNISNINNNKANNMQNSTMTRNDDNISVSVYEREHVIQPVDDHQLKSQNTLYMIGIATILMLILTLFWWQRKKSIQYKTYEKVPTDDIQDAGN